MPPLRRRRIGAAAPNLSLGSLLADADRERRLKEEADAQAKFDADKAAAEAERQAAIAKQEARRAESDRSRLYNSVIKDYMEGNATYESTLASLQAALATEDNAELKEYLRSYITTTKTTKTSRDISAKVKAYNEGSVKYDELVQFLQGVQSENEVIKETVSTSLATARQAENNRIQNKLTSDYNAGRVDIDQYISGLTGLRDANQTNPVEMERLTVSIEQARQMKKDLADQQTYSDWQTGKLSDGEALTYFQGRANTATNPKDAANATKFLGVITQHSQSRGASNATQYDKAAREYASNTMKAWAEQKLEPAIEACAGDPACIMSAYDTYGKVMAQIAGVAGSDGQWWKGQAALAGTYGQERAAVEQYNKLQARIKELKVSNGDTPEQILEKMGQKALLALDGRESQYQTDAAKAEFNRAMADAANQVIATEREMIAKATDENEQLKAELQGAYDDVRRGGEKREIEQFAAQYGILFDGKSEDFKKFSEWMSGDPSKNAALIYDLARPLKTGNKVPVSDNARDKFVEDFRRIESSPAMQQANKLLTGFIQIVNPGTTLAEAQHVAKLVRFMDAGSNLPGGTDAGTNRGLTAQLLFDAKMLQGIQDIDAEVKMLQQRMELRRRTEAQAPNQIDWAVFDQGSITKPAPAKTAEEQAMDERREGALGMGGGPRGAGFPTPKTDPVADITKGFLSGLGEFMEGWKVGPDGIVSRAQERKNAELQRSTSHIQEPAKDFTRFSGPAVSGPEKIDIPRFTPPPAATFAGPTGPGPGLDTLSQDMGIPRFTPFGGPKPPTAAPQIEKRDAFGGSGSNFAA